MVGVSNPKWREEPKSQPVHILRGAPNQTNKSNMQVTLKQERVRASVCARGVHVEGQEREEEKGNTADTPRSAKAPGRKGFCFGPSPAGGGGHMEFLLEN